MSVDFYHCTVCNESLYEEYVGSCTSCGKSLCSSCLINNDVGSRYAHDYGLKFDPSNPELMEQYKKDGYTLNNEDGKSYYEEGDVLDDSAIDKKYCPYCSGESIDREKVLAYLLKKHKLHIKDVWKELNK